MKLFWCPRTRSQRVLWMLEELDINYERVLIDIRDPQAEHDPGFAKASPMGKVPALENGEVRMADSAAICLYLADLHPNRRLAPAIHETSRGAYLYWMLYTPGAIEPAMMEKFANLEPNRSSAGWGDFDTMMETLIGGLQPGPWILGDAFSAADVMLGSSVYFMQVFDMLPDSPTLTEYLTRCRARPAFRKAAELDASA